ncbi:MAG: carboxypeptidase-like regulatory domain-containing protein [Paraprevotella sp.]|nr:carboxypeptidase-like regulatory domain-containing protein [Paraprevotella sp.]
MVFHSNHIQLKRFLTTLFLVVATLLNLHAQRVSGTVTDAETGEPLPYVNVYYKHDKRLGTTTDINGKYSLTSNMAPGDLIFSFLGYDTHEIKVKYGSRSTHNVKLRPLDKLMAEVVVKPKKQKYKRKNNPAVELIKKVIDAKGRNDLKLNSFYKYYKYQKLTFALNGIDSTQVDSGPLKNLPLLARQVEFCPQIEKNILPLTYNETLTECLYSRKPEREREYIRGTNSEGLNNLFSTGEMVTTILQSVFTHVNIYDNTIYLLERPFTSPISSDNAISFYQYFIMDTVMVDGEKCIEMSYIPQNPQDFGFSGRLLILADNYQVKRCIINLPVRTSVNFVNNLVIEQDFALQSNGQRILVKDNMFAELGVVKKHRNIMVKRSVHYTNICFDSIPDHAFKEEEQLREGTYENKDQDFWAQHRTEQLTKSEENMARMLDEARQSPVFGPTMFIARALIENYVETAPAGKKNYVDIGPINTIVSDNFIENIRLRASAQTTAHFNPNLFLKGYVAYGFKDKKVKYEGEVEYSFLRKKYSPNEFPKNSITLATRYDVMTPADLLAPRDKDNVFVSFKTQTVDQMMYLREHRLKYEYEFNNHFGFSTQLRHHQQTPTGSLSYTTMAGTPINRIKESEATIALRYSPGEKLINSKQRRIRVNNNAPIFSFTHTTGFKGIAGGQHNYNFTELSTYQRIWFHSFGRLDINLKAGAQWNQVPFPLLIFPAANNSYFITDNMFCLMNNMEFLNDRYAYVDLQWDLNGKLLNRIPLIKRLKWREVIGFKSMWGELTEKNQTEIHPDSDKLFQMPSRNGETYTHMMDKDPYMELNVGLHNILKIFRIDYVYRINYHQNPNVKKHGVRFCVEFDF